MTYNCGCENTEDLKNKTRIRDRVDKLISHPSAVFKIDSPEKMKFYEIRQMAWEIYQLFVSDPRYKTHQWTADECFKDAWYFAKTFYKFAKEKEGEIHE